MERIPYENMVDFLGDASLIDLNWMWDRINLYLQKVLQYSTQKYGTKKFSELVPEFQRK